MTRKYALITGASSGIGEAMARLVTAEGFDLGLVARREDRLERLALALRQYGVEVDTFAADLSAPRAGERLAQAVAAKGRDVSILVNNAGVTIAKSFSATNLSEQQAFARHAAEGVWAHHQCGLDHRAFFRRQRQHALSSR